ncbi:peptide MFS transporter [Actinomycetospora corticicola]|uniref:POT family proton-dependent oligopeptide transporter n=1 Tax=Actinomycetospora corticicola TaxID=663602 RepID=A0A7Y9J4H1_9PSEU|nr:POT family proton-dependent oligopeptide transporter [Actinomycetospora corticicola]
MTITPGNPDDPKAVDPADGGVTTADTPDPGQDVSADRRFFGHPLALANLFSVELWERFSFYGMQAVMAYYLYYSLAEGGLGLPKEAATSIIGAYGGMVYLACVGGAWIADRVLGAERTLFFAACTVMLGHIALALIPGLAGVVVGLVLVALGSGGVKTAATSVVGSLYRRDDPRADAGFSIFYMGVNIGALVGPLLTGLAQTTIGFHWAFGLAAIGMALGLGIYVTGRKNLPASANVVPTPLTPGAWQRPVGIVVGAVVVIALLFVFGVLTAENLSTAVAIVVALIAIALFTLLLRSPKVSADERSRTRAYIPMWLASVVFWSLFQQQFTVVTLYTDERLDRMLGGWEMPIAWVNSLEPFFVIVLAPLFAILWTRLGERGPSTPVKFAIGAGGMGVAFLLFLPWAGGTGNTTPVLAIVLIMLVFALAEMNLSPVGLSLSTRIGPDAFRSQSVALFYLSVSLGSTLAGTMAGFYDPSTEGTYFSVIGIAALVLGGVLLALAPWVRRAMRGVR